MTREEFLEAHKLEMLGLLVDMWENARKLDGGALVLYLRGATGKISANFGKMYDTLKEQFDAQKPQQPQGKQPAPGAPSGSAKTPPARGSA